MFSEHVTASVNTYYQLYQDLIGIQVLSSLFPGAFVVQPRNIDGAQAYGVEGELTYRVQNGSLSFWYAYNDFEPNQPQQPIRAFLPAKHKVGVTGRVHLPEGWTLNANYKFVDITRNDPVQQGQPGGIPVDRQHRLDLSIAKKLLDDRGEIMVGVMDVFDQTDVVVGLIGTTVFHETPGRTAYVRFQLKF